MLAPFKKAYPQGEYLTYLSFFFSAVTLDFFPPSVILHLYFSKMWKFNKSEW